MPREKTGKYVECYLKGCSKKKYYPLSAVKKNNCFYCCFEHSSKDSALRRRKGEYKRCELPGCTNKKYYSPAFIKPGKSYYCCPEHHNKAQQTGKYIECDLEGCSKKKYHSRSNINRNQHFFCCIAHKLKFEREGEYRVCHFPGCTKKKYYSPSKLFDDRVYYCSNDHRDKNFARVQKEQALYPKTGRLRILVRDRQRSKQACENLEDVYVRRRVARQFDLSSEEIPEKLLQIKRKQLIIHRLQHD